MGLLDKFKDKNASKSSGASPTQQSTTQAPASNQAKPAEPSAPGSGSASQPQKAAPTDMASLQRAKNFVELFKSRRTIYALSKKRVIPDSEIVGLIKACVRETPSSFNQQSSRVVILLGDAHDSYWNETVTKALRDVVPDDEMFQKGKERLDGFAKAYGTALFFEDDATIEQMQKNIASYADRFPEWSTHSTGMAQIHTWTTLELAGFGANLQHYGNLSGPAIISKLGLSDKWKLHAELVFGHPEGGAGEKTYIDDGERFKVVGASS